MALIPGAKAEGKAEGKATPVAGPARGCNLQIRRQVENPAPLYLNNFMMSVQNGNPSFNAKLTTGNPLPQTVRVVDTNLVRWTVRNSQHTPWLKVTPNGDFGDGIFSVSVNIYDSSVILGVQTATLFVESFVPGLALTITCTITLTVTAT